MRWGNSERNGATLRSPSKSVICVSIIVSLFTLDLHPAFATDAMTLDQVLDLARNHSETVQAADKAVQSVEAEIAARDLVLSPRLSVDFADARDTRHTLGPNQRFHAQLLDVELTKLFSTGTSLTFGAGHQITDLNSADATANGTRNIGAWEIRLSQALWRDAFGRGTTLRRRSEAAEKMSRTLAVVNQRQVFFVSLEAAYWDLALAIKQEEIQRNNIELSKSVEKWTRDRVNRFSAEPTDLLQAQALVSNRQLSLIAIENQIQSLKNRLRELIPNVNPDNWVLDLTSLEISRPLNSLMVAGGGSSEPVRLDTLVSTYSARQAQEEAARVDDNLRPRLDAYVSYGQNGSGSSFGPAWSQAADASNNAARIGVLLSVDLDWRLKDERRRAANLSAQSRELEARAQQRSSLVGWNDLNREITELQKQVKEARRLADFQTRKADAERRRYRLGRTTVFQLITFEVDASEAELQVYRLLANLRKAESRARLFTRQQDGV